MIKKVMSIAFLGFLGFFGQMSAAIATSSCNSLLAVNKKPKAMVSKDQVDIAVFDYVQLIKQAQSADNQIFRTILEGELQKKKRELIEGGVHDLDSRIRQILKSNLTTKELPVPNKTESVKDPSVEPEWKRRSAQSADVEMWQATKVIDLNRLGYIEDSTYLAISPRGRVMALAERQENILNLVDVRAEQVIERVKIPEGVSEVLFSSDGSKLAVLSNLNEVMIFQVTYFPVYKLELKASSKSDYKNQVQSLWTKDSRQLVSFEDGELLVRNFDGTVTNKILLPINNAKMILRDMAISKDGKHLAVALKHKINGDSQLIIVETKTWKVSSENIDISTHSGHVGGSFFNLSFINNDKQIAFSSAGHSTVVVLDLKSLKMSEVTAFQQAKCKNPSEFWKFSNENGNFLMFSDNGLPHIGTLNQRKVTTAFEVANPTALKKHSAETALISGDGEHALFVFNNGRALLVEHPSFALESFSY